MSQSDNYDLLNKRAQYLMEVGRPKEAKLLLHKALALEPEGEEGLFLLTACLIIENDFEKAQSLSEKLLALAPEEPDYIVQAVGIMICRAESFKPLAAKKMRLRALALAQQAVALDAEDSIAWQLLADTNLSLGQHGPAKEAAQKACSLNPEDPGGLFSVGLIATKEKKWKEAENIYRQILTVDPEHLNAQNNLGVVLNKLGREREAIDMFTAAASLNPEDELVKENLKGTVRRFSGTSTFCFGLLVWLSIKGFQAMSQLDDFSGLSGTQIGGIIIGVVALSVALLWVGDWVTKMLSQKTKQTLTVDPQKYDQLPSAAKRYMETQYKVTTKKPALSLINIILGVIFGFILLLVFFLLFRIIVA